MQKLTLNPNATFKHTVYIPIAGDEPAPLTLTFKQRGNKDMQKFVEQHKESWTAETILDCATGWDLAEPFNKENVELLIDNYPLALARIVGGYIEEIYNAREKN